MKYEPIEKRFWKYVDRRSDKECWNWLGTKDDGYGRLCKSRTRGTIGAHRVAYELLIGPIPEGMMIDHLCRNRGCVNPAHMEIVTNETNLLRGNGKPAINARKTHCVRGHEFTEENTYHPPKKNERHCRECKRIQEAGRPWRKR